MHEEGAALWQVAGLVHWGAMFPQACAGVHKVLRGLKSQGIAAGCCAQWHRATARLHDLWLQVVGQIVARVAGGHLDDVLRGAGRHHLTAAIAAFGAHVDDPVGGFDHI